MPTYTVGAWNLADIITIGSHREQYVYDPDGQRLYRSHNGLNTIYLDDGLVELDYPGNANYPSRTYYRFNGQVVAQASKTAPNSARTLVWLHGDQLGSTSLLTDSGGVQSGPPQEFDPWGAVRSGRLSAPP